VLLALLGDICRASPLSVSDGRASQRAGTRLVDVYYDISGGLPPYSVTLQGSLDGGTTWTLPVTTVTGNVGTGVTAGINRVITWNAGVDWAGLVSVNAKFRVTASDTLTVNGAPILVLNGGFEDPTPHNPNNGTNADWTDGTWAFVGAPWTTNMNQYGRITYSFFAVDLPPLTGGVNWVVNMCNQPIYNWPGSIISQSLGSYSFNVGYTLSVTFHVFRESYDITGGELKASFLVGSTEYSQTFDTATQNTWQSYTLTKTIPAGVTGNLSIRFQNVSGRAGWLDNVSDVTVTPAPVPGP